MKKILIGTIFIALNISTQSHAEDVTIETDIGPLEATTSQIPDKMEQDIRALSPEELGWISASRTKARILIGSYLNLKDVDLFTPEILDETYNAWLSDTSNDKVSQNSVIEVLGVAYGTHVLRNFPSEWKVITDMYGTDLALVFKNSSKQIFPISSVGKRISRGETDFFVPLYSFTKEVINKR